jgi:hypothetical protein
MTSSVPGISAEQLVRNLWPQTGPSSPALIKGAAIALYELVGYLIHASGPEHRAAALPEPADGHALVANLRAAADAGQHLCRALADWVDGLAGDPNLFQRRLQFDDSPFPRAVERPWAAAQALRSASTQSAELAASFTCALDALAPLYLEH